MLAKRAYRLLSSASCFALLVRLARFQGGCCSTLPTQVKLTAGPRSQPAMLAFPCAQDKVNISVAIIPMAQDFGWSPTVAGLVQSSFFYGYLLSQIPGGYVSSLLGGRRVLPAGVALWSVATAAVPVLAGTIPGGPGRLGAVLKGWLF